MFQRPAEEGVQHKQKRAGAKPRKIQDEVGRTAPQRPPQVIYSIVYQIMNLVNMDLKQSQHIFHQLFLLVLVGFIFILFLLRSHFRHRLPFFFFGRGLARDALVLVLLLFLPLLLLLWLGI